MMRWGRRNVTCCLGMGYKTTENFETVYKLGFGVKKS